MTSGSAEPEYSAPSGGILTCDALLTPSQTLRPAWLQVAKTKVVALGAGAPPRPADRCLPAGSIVVPGFVDTHVHGGGGHSMTVPDPDEICAATAYHADHGSTATLVSLITASHARLTDSLAVVADLVERRPATSGRVLGSHLEGPYLSAHRRGAHPAALLAQPSTDRTTALLEAARGTLRMVTAAPELPGTLGAGGLIEQLRDNGVIAAVGHTDASYEDTRRALSQGMTTATHLFNGMRPLHHRDPGPIPAVLEHEGTWCELINDGVHVHPAVARIAARTAGVGRLVLISDAVAATGAADGEYFLGESAIVRRGTSIRTADGTSLGGSDLTLATAVRRAVTTLGLSVSDAVAAATSAPADAIGCGDTAGRLEAGRSADLVVLDQDLQVLAVMLAGAWIRRPADVAGSVDHAQGSMSGSHP